MTTTDACFLKADISANEADISGGVNNAEDLSEIPPSPRDAAQRPRYINDLFALI